MTYLELKEILTSENPSEGLKAKEHELFNFIPELRKSKGFNQNNEWHPYDVLEHTYHVVDGVENDLILRLAALFHDIGKPYVYTEDENGVGHFYGHWEVSKDIFLKFAKKRNLDSKTRTLVSRLIYFHDLSTSKMTPEQLGYFSKQEIIKLFKLKRADVLAQNPEKHEEILDKYELEEEEILTKKKY